MRDPEDGRLQRLRAWPSTYNERVPERQVRRRRRRAGHARLRVPGRALRCNAQCHRLAVEFDACRAAPTSALEAADGGGISDRVKEMNWMQFLILGGWVVTAIGGVMFLRSCLFPPSGSRRVLGIASAVLGIFGLALFIFSMLTVNQVSSMAIELLGQQIQEFIGNYVFVGFGVIGLILFFTGVFSLLGIYYMSPRILIVVFAVWVAMLLLQIIVNILVAWWLVVLDDVPNSALESLQGTSNGRYDGKFGASALVEVEGFVCRAYQKCCRPDPRPARCFRHRLGQRRRVRRRRQRRGGRRRQPACVYAHEGTSTDVAIALEDPSSPQFCPYVTGSSIVSRRRRASATRSTTSSRSRPARPTSARRGRGLLTS